MTPPANGGTLWINGQPAAAAALAAWQTNYGHLTTMQVRNGAVQGLDRHVARLQAANLELFASPLPQARVRAELGAALSAADMRDATLRVSVVAVDPGSVEQGGPAAVAMLVAVSAPCVAPSSMRVRSHVLVRPLAHLKHLATMPLLHARRAARAAGADDALLVGADGLVAEGSLWNVGFVDAGGIVWPAADALRGTTEAVLRDALAHADIAQRDAPVRLPDIGGMQAAFACNSRGLWPLASIDGRAMPGDPAMITRLRGVLDASPWIPLAG